MLMTSVIIIAEVSAFFVSIVKLLSFNETKNYVLKSIKHISI